MSVRAVTAGRIALDARALECHAAKVTLGPTPGAIDDLFWPPGSSVDINVRSAKDGFDGATTACASEDARQILDRANAFHRAPPRPREAPFASSR